MVKICRSNELWRLLYLGSASHHSPDAALEALANDIGWRRLYFTSKLQLQARAGGFQFTTKCHSCAQFKILQIHTLCASMLKCVKPATYDQHFWHWFLKCFHIKDRGIHNLCQATVKIWHPSMVTIYCCRHNQNRISTEVFHKAITWTMPPCIH